MPLVEILAGATAAVLVGRSALPGGRRVSAPALAEDFLLGLSIVVPLALAWGLVGLPWTPVAMPLLAVAIAGLLRLARRRGPETGNPPAEPVARADRAALALLGATLLVSVWKWARSPLWSWDHVAIWGMKARRLVQDGALDLGFLKLAMFRGSHPDYPIGLPVAVRFLSPSLPEAVDFRLVHALFAAVLVAAVYGGARRLRASAAISAVVAALLCASPLFWDTEALGLADLPLACVAVGALLLVLDARDDPAFPAWTGGAALGFLAWIKTEGLVLGALLVVLAVLSAPPARDRWRRRGTLVAVWAAWSLGALAVRRVWLSPGLGFFEGDWTDRVSARAGFVGTILRALLAELAGAEWLGLWFLFAVSAAAALALRRRGPGLVALVVLAQLACYLFVYLGTFVAPLEHIDSSFRRLAGALAPLAVLTIAGAAGAIAEKRDRSVG